MVCPSGYIYDLCNIINNAYKISMLLIENAKLKQELFFHSWLTLLVEVTYSSDEYKSRIERKISFCRLSIQQYQNFLNLVQTTFIANEDFK